MFDKGLEDVLFRSDNLRCCLRCLVKCRPEYLVDAFAVMICDGNVGICGSSVTRCIFTHDCRQTERCKHTSSQFERADNITDAHLKVRVVDRKITLRLLLGRFL